MGRVLLLALLALASSAVAQPGPQAPATIGGTFHVGTSAPSATADGVAWLRDTDFQFFVYDTANGEWLGELRTAEFGSGNASSNGPMLFAAHAQTDTTLNAETGAEVGRARIVAISGSTSSGTPSTTLQLFGVAHGAEVVTRGTAFTWDNSYERADWVPGAADTIGATNVLACYITGAAIGDPAIVVYYRERVAP